MSVIDRIAAQAAADIIKNEVVANANTASRVGGLLRDIADSAAIGSVVPVSISADQNNWGPTDFAKAKDGGLRVVTNNTTQRIITGFLAQAHGFRFRLLNRGPGAVRLSHQNGASIAANQIYVSNFASEAYLPANDGSCELEYDATMGKWCVTEGFYALRNQVETAADIAATAAIGTSALWAPSNHVHRLPTGGGLGWNGSNQLEAIGEPSPTHSATLATADATITTALTIPLADNTRYDVRAIITGRSDTNALILQEVSVRYSRKSAGAPVQSGTPVAPSTNSVPVGIGYVIDTSSNDLRIRVQGAAAMDINWDVKAWVVARALPAQPA